MKQLGFTMLELLVALALGAIVMASVVLLFVGGQQNLMIQNSASALQDDQNFGLSYIASGIRLANLNNPTAHVRPNVLRSGIVFSSDNFPDHVTVNGDFNDQYVTQLTDTESNFSNASADLLQDQIVIQYRPAEIGGFDCTGTEITTRNEYVVERYFIRTDNKSAAHESSDQSKFVLACAAGRYLAEPEQEEAEDEGAAPIILPSALSSSFYTDGQVILKRVELFKIRFLVEDNNGNRSYMHLEDYNGLTSDHPRILAVQLGLIARGTDPVPDTSLTLPNRFTLWTDYTVELDDGQGRYMRTPLVQTIALRNALGARQ